MKNDPTDTDRRYKMEVESESEYEGNEVRDEWMKSQDAKKLLSRWHIKESKEDNEITSKMRGASSGDE